MRDAASQTAALSSKQTQTLDEETGETKLVWMSLADVFAEEEEAARVQREKEDEEVAVSHGAMIGRFSRKFLIDAGKKAHSLRRRGPGGRRACGYCIVSGDV